MWRTAGLICVGLIPLAAIGFYLLIVLSKRGEAKLQARLKESGQVVKGWIVFANETLYHKNHPTNVWPAQVVFTFNRELERRDGYLAKIAEEIRNFVPADPKDHDERVLGQVVRSHFGYHFPLRIPERIAGNDEVYSLTVDVFCERLPGYRLTLPYIYCRVLLDPEKHSKGIGRMMAYPDDERAAIAEAAGAEPFE